MFSQNRKSVKLRKAA